MFDPAFFDSDFFAVQTEPTPEPELTPEPSEGPWISHGTVHLARPPINH
jgi:hypothetical protein